MSRSRLRRQRKIRQRSAEQFLELLARGGTFGRRVLRTERITEIYADLPNPNTGGGWFMAMRFANESLRGDPKP